MTGKNIITINGRAYDAISGMPLTHARSDGAAAKPRPQPRPNHQPHAKPHPAFSDINSPVAHREHAHPAAHAVHKQLQKSQTLYRAALKKPTPVSQSSSTSLIIKQRAAVEKKPAYQQSPAISKFGPGHNQSDIASSPKPAAAIEQPAKPPRAHPIVHKVLTQQQQQSTPVQTPAAQSSKELKEMLIKERLAEAEPNTQEVKKRRRGLFARQPRLATILTSSLALLLLAGYLTYINLPNISMRVAATRAGIAASFPHYKPDGYSFNGPITYAPGEVTINFKSNTNSQSFTVQQKASNWDSQAVLDNYVSKKSDTYLTYQERGLTIYSFGNHAAWVNGGLLYTVNGDAPLSSDQLLRIATSM